MLRVTLSGVESTGKSTLAAELAAHFGGIVVWEFGRTYTEVSVRPLTLKDHHAIAEGHASHALDVAAQNPPVLIEDTDIVMTTAWATMLFGKRDPVLAARKSEADLHLLMLPDVPFVADPVRMFGDARNASASTKSWSPNTTPGTSPMCPSAAAGTSDGTAPSPQSRGSCDKLYRHPALHPGRSRRRRPRRRPVSRLRAGADTGGRGNGRWLVPAAVQRRASIRGASGSPAGHRPLLGLSANAVRPSGSGLGHPVATGLEPVDVGRFHIHTAEHPGAHKPGQWPIRIDAGLAFGTGQHATTAGCIAAAVRMAKRGNARNIPTSGQVRGFWPLQQIGCTRGPASRQPISMRSQRWSHGRTHGSTACPPGGGAVPSPCSQHRASSMYSSSGVRPMILCLRTFSPARWWPWRHPSQQSSSAAVHSSSPASCNHRRAGFQRPTGRAAWFLWNARAMPNGRCWSFARPARPAGGQPSGPPDVKQRDVAGRQIQSDPPRIATTSGAAACKSLTEPSFILRNVQHGMFPFFFSNCR
jgi:nicotinamide riboside kinase